MYYQGEIRYTFSFQVLQKAVLILNSSGLRLVPVIKIKKCHDGLKREKRIWWVTKNWIIKVNDKSMT